MLVILQETYSPPRPVIQAVEFLLLDTHYAERVFEAVHLDERKSIVDWAKKIAPMVEKMVRSMVLSHPPRVLGTYSVTQIEVRFDMFAEHPYTFVLHINIDYPSRLGIANQSTVVDINFTTTLQVNFANSTFRPSSPIAQSP